MKLRITWKAQLILFIEGVLALLLVVMLWYINSYLFQMLLRYNEESQLKNLQHVESKLNECRTRMENWSSAAFVNRTVQKFYSGNYKMDREGVLLRQEIGEYLGQQLQTYPEIHSIFIRASNGSEIGSEANYTYNTWDNSWHRELRGSKWILEKTPSHSLQRPKQGHLLSFSNTYQFQGKGVEIILKMDEEAIARIYSGFIESSDASILLCDRNGLILSSSVKSEIGTIFEPFARQIQGNLQGSFVFEDTIQTIYLTIAELDWVIVERMPIEHFNREIVKVRKTLLYLLLISIALINLLIYIMMKRMLQPMKTLTAAMHRLQDGEIGHQIQAVFHNEFDGIIQTFNSMSCSTAQLIEQNRIEEEQKRLYAMSALRAQINPHFLFNTINTIKWMAISQQAANIKAALDMLMVLLRPLFKETSDETTLRDELEYASNYISLVNLRFGGNVELVVDIPDELLTQTMPNFVLQPIIENCIEHGFGQHYSQAKVIVDAVELDTGLLLTIRDNGSGITEEKLAELYKKLALTDSILPNGEKLGLANVNLRIRLKYGGSYGITLESGKDCGTVVMVKLP